MKIRPGRYLIPDVAVFYPDEPAEVPVKPPLVAIKFPSPDDRQPAFEAKLNEDWGIPHIWLVDPDTKQMFVWKAARNKSRN